MKAATPSCWFLIAIMAIMVVGHVCASPFHAHAGAIATHEEHDDVGTGTEFAGPASRSSFFLTSGFSLGF